MNIEVKSQERDVVLRFPAGSRIGPARQFIKKVINELARGQTMIGFVETT